EINRTLRQMHPQVVADATVAIQNLGGTVKRDPLTDLITVNDEFTASIVVSRCMTTGGGALRWNIRLDTSLRPDINVAVRMNQGNTTVLDYYLFPRIDCAVAPLR